MAATKKNQKERLRRALSVFIFLLGLAIFCYPMVSRFYYQIEATQVIDDFSEAKSLIPQEEIDKRISLAKAYNADLNGVKEFHDPYVKNIQEGRKHYAYMLEAREKIGVVRVPKQRIEEPIFAGTSEDVLQHGVGHMEYTSLPVGGESTHAVLTGHRGLPDKKIFTTLNKVKKGDVFYVENIKEILAYQVDQIKVIEPNHWDDLYIVKGQDYVTLLTCTPYMINTHRLLVRGHRIPYVPEEYEKAVQTAHWTYWAMVAGVIALVLLVVAWLTWRRRNKKKK